MGLGEHVKLDYVFMNCESTRIAVGSIRLCETDNQSVDCHSLSPSLPRRTEQEHRQMTMAEP